MRRRAPDQKALEDKKEEEEEEEGGGAAPADKAGGESTFARRGLEMHAMSDCQMAVNSIGGLCDGHFRLAALLITFSQWFWRQAARKLLVRVQGRSRDDCKAVMQRLRGAGGVFAIQRNWAKGP